MPEQFLCDFDIYTTLSEQVRHAMAERVPSNFPVDADPFKGGPNMPLEDHVWLQWLFPVLLDRREQIVLL